MDTTTNIAKMDITGIELTKKHQDFSGIKWVLKAINKKRNRIILRSILFDSGKWVGTDGSRIHIYESQESFKEGIYESIINNSGKLILKFISDDLTKYPIWRNIFHSSKAPLELKINFVSDLSVEYTKIIRCMEASVTLDFQFFENLLMGNIDPWIVHIYEKLDPIYFMSERKTGIIMPMQI